MSQIKNFPHQYNDLNKVRATLEVYADLRRRGRATADDGVLGYALARRGTYRFRDVDYAGSTDQIEARVEARISQEVRKPPSTQGARTAAREMRRTLRSLGWVAASGDLTDTGENILSSTPGSDEERLQVRHSLMNITAEDVDANRSHPVWVLLRLIDDVPFTSRRGMELALVAKDDSASEYSRVVEMAGLSHKERQEVLNATENQMNNAVKILPSFALQAGLMTDDGTGRYTLTGDGHAELRAVVDSGSFSIGTVNAAPAQGSTTTQGSLRPRPSRREDIGSQNRDLSSRSPLTPEEQAEAARRLMERTNRHQEIVAHVVAWAPEGTLYEDQLSFDLLMEPDDEALPLLLWEAKSVDDDARAQARAAAGQLSFYEYFNVRPHWPDRPVRRIAVFDKRINAELLGFLSDQGVAAFGVDGSSLDPLNGLAAELEPLLVDPRPPADLGNRDE